MCVYVCVREEVGAIALSFPTVCSSSRYPRLFFWHVPALAMVSGLGGGRWEASVPMARSIWSLTR